ncbi:MAG: HAMP domain-containing histidine kinase [Deltaproteobacteria bacterium]|nr:HAMP domain-containing histidine kinase [Deltaproteobacteria bacterium]
MKLARKLALAVTGTVLIVAAVLAVLRLGAERTHLADEMASDQQRFGHILASLLERCGDEDDDGALVAHLDGSQVTVRLSPLAAVGSESRASVRRGRDATRTDDASMTTWIPLRRDGNVVAALTIDEPLTDLAEFESVSWQQTAAGTLASLVVTLLLVFAWSASFVGRPLGRLVQHSRRVASGDLTVRTTLSQKDEVGELAIEMNRMTEQLEVSRRELERETGARLATLEQLRHSDRLRTVGQLASGMAHELGTPLNVVAGHAQLIASGESTADETAESARVIGEQAKRMTSLVRQLLSYARRGQPKREHVDLAELSRSVTTMLSPVARKRDVSLVIDADADTITLADPVQVQQALTNLVMNAIDASPAGATVRVRVGTATAAAPDEAGPARARRYIAVEDSGIGIPTADLERVFEPFYTTKATGEGTGLGLPLVAGIARDHDGWVAVESRVGHGSRFTLSSSASKSPRSGRVPTRSRAPRSATSTPSSPTSRCRAWMVSSSAPASWRCDPACRSWS